MINDKNVSLYGNLEDVESRLLAAAGQLPGHNIPTRNSKCQFQPQEDIQISLRLQWKQKLMIYNLNGKCESYDQGYIQGWGEKTR